MKKWRKESAVLLGILVAIALAAQAHWPTRAAPLEQPEIGCEWLHLAIGRESSRHTLVTLPGVGVLAYSHWGIGLLDLRTDPQGEWQDLKERGKGLDNPGDHSAVMRPAASGLQEMVAFGGRPGAGSRDVRRLVLGEADSTWSVLPSARSARAGHVAVYDPVEDAMIAVGGETANGWVTSIDRLVLNGDPRWEQLPQGRSPQLHQHTAFYDGRRKRVIVYGGFTESGSAVRDVYSLNLANGWANATWERLSTAGTLPRPRGGHGSVYLPDLNWMVIYGGFPDYPLSSQLAFDDIHALDLNDQPPTWRSLTPSSGGPGPLADMAAAYSDIGAYAVFSGGVGSQIGGRSTGDTWALKCAAATPSATSTNAASGTPTATDVPPATDTPTMTWTPVATNTPTPTLMPLPTATSVPTGAPTPTGVARWWVYLPGLRQE